MHAHGYRERLATTVMYVAPPAASEILVHVEAVCVEVVTRGRCGVAVAVSRATR